MRHISWKRWLASVLTVTMLAQAIPATTFAQTDGGLSTAVTTDAPSVSAGDPSAEPQTTILGEDISRRKENEKHFRQSDGTYVEAIYSQPVHFEQDGQMVEIDNTLEEKTDEQGTYYENRANALKVQLPDKSSGNRPVSVSTEGYTLQWTLQNQRAVTAQLEQPESQAEQQQILAARLKTASTEETQRAIRRRAQMEVDNQESSVTYPQLLGDTDLVYDLQSTRLKESLILKTRTGQSRYVFSMEGEGLTPALQKDGSVFVYGQNREEPVFVIASPYMFDSDFAYCDAIEVQVQVTDSGFDYILLPDEEWLNSSERVYPVTIDPTVMLQRDYTSIHDTTAVFNANSAGHSFTGETPYLQVGKLNEGPKVAALVHTDIDFEPNYRILNATLNLCYHVNNPNMGLKAIRVTSNWKMDNSIIYSGGMPSYDLTVLDYVDTTGAANGSWATFDITKAVQMWANGTANYGIMVYTSNTSGRMSFFDSDHTGTASDPKFVITYRDTKGLEPYWDYTTVSAGEAGTAYVNNYTGNLVFVHGDAATAGDLMPAGIDHVYNGYMANTKYTDVKPALGHGWKLSVQQTVRATDKSYQFDKATQAQYPYVYTDGDGTEHFFYKKTSAGSTKYYDEDGLGLELKKLSSGYTITDDSDTVMTFNAKGNLSSVKNANGVSMTIGYESDNTTIKTVKDGAGKVLTVTPNLDTGSGYIRTITDPAGRKTTFTFDTGKLVHIIYPDGTDSRYTYDSKGHLLTTTDANGYKLTFTYKTVAGVPVLSKITESTTTGKTGQTILFDFSEQNVTKITTSGKDNTISTSDDLKTTYQFDTYGRTVSVQGAMGSKAVNAATYTYTAGQPSSDASNIKQLNRLTGQYAAGLSGANLVKGHSLESASGWTGAAWNASGGNTVSWSHSYVSDQRYAGAKSLKINVSSVKGDARGRVYQDVSKSVAKPGKTYTLSAYVKTSGVQSPDAEFGASLIVDSFNSDGSYTKFYSDYLYGTTATSINNGWRRLSVTFTVPSNSDKVRLNLNIRGCTGTAWFDAVQLEEGSAPTPYNLLENAGMETSSSGAPANWSKTAMVSGDTLDTGTKHTGSRAFKVTAGVDSDKELVQTLSLSGAKETDTYIVSGWAKANALPSPEDDRKFKISVAVTYSDGTVVWKSPANFNPAVSSWQYASSIFNLSDGTSANKTPTKIGVYVRYWKQANSGWFDDIQLTRDEIPSYTYDKDGNLTTVTANAEQQSNMEYQNNDLTKSVDSKGYAYSYTYDSKHNVTKAVSQTGVSSNYTYNSKGQATRLDVKSASGSMVMRSEVTYDGAFVSKTTDSRGNTVNYTYDKNKGLLKSAADGQLTVNYTYNANNDLPTKVSFAGENTTRSVSYTYDKHRLKGITHNAFNYALTYDDFGNRLTTKAGNYTLSTNTYEKNNGALSQVSYGNGARLNYTYDNYGNLASVSQNGVKRFQWTADTTGRTVGHDDLLNNIRYRYIYDMSGRTVRVDASRLPANTSDDLSLYNVEYNYDLNNNVTLFRFQSNGRAFSSKYSYGKDNLPSKFDMYTDRTTNYAYDGLNRLSSVTVGTTTPIKMAYTYLLSERNTSGQSLYRTNLVRTEDIGSNRYRYTYDERSNITKIEQQINGSYATVAEYTYDDFGQLLSESLPQKNRKVTYAYNAGGNITKRTETTLSTGAVLDTINYSYGDSTWKDKLTSYDGKSITYDAIGNPLSYRNGITLTWKNGRELATLKNGSHTVSYQYDAAGMRVSKTVDGEKHTYRYVDGALQYESFGSRELYYTYDAYGSPATIQYYNNGTLTGTYYLAHNFRGDVTDIYTGAGELRAHYEYDAWGNPLSITDQNGNDIISTTHIGQMNSLRYRGYVYDSESGLYYLQSRYYDPLVGRFVNADVYVSTGQGINGANMYAYCLNNPVKYTDAGGQFVISALALTVIVDIACSTLLAVCIAYLAYQVIDYYWTDGSSALALPETNKKADVIPFPAPSQNLGPDIATITPFEPDDDTSEVLYYALYIKDGYIQQIPGVEPMSFSEAKSWTFANANTYSVPWGIYTLTEYRALSLVIQISQQRQPVIGPQIHDNTSSFNPPFFYHYHPVGRKVGGISTDFHVWYGPACW